MSAWTPAPPAELDWLREVATDDDPAGYEVGPMPDEVWLLHSIGERLDGKPILDGVTLHTDARGDVYYFDDPSRPGPPRRRVRWSEYATRKGIPMSKPPHRFTIQDALPGIWHDEFVSPPDEGDPDDGTLEALYAVLLKHSPRGAETTCVAYWCDFYVGDPDDPPGHGPSNLLRGPLGAWREAYDPELLGDRSISPQNLWPADRSWVVQTHVDSWATAVSGPPALIEDLITHPDLEALRM